MTPYILLHIYPVLAIVDLVVILFCLSQSPARKRLCQIALLVNAVALGLAAFPFWDVFVAMRTSADAGLGIVGLLVISAPVLVETFVLAMIYWRRLREPRKPST